jgi:sigma-B regulation protein RsbU (phosphoserine phosphatase)
MEEFKIRRKDVQLEAGDILLLYTDGVTEAENLQKEQFGRGRLANMIRQNADLSADEIIQKVLGAVNEFAAGTTLADDVTLVVYKAN